MNSLVVHTDILRKVVPYQKRPIVLIDQASFANGLSV